jgi:hypothetical protein
MVYLLFSTPCWKHYLTIATEILADPLQRYKNYFLQKAPSVVILARSCDFVAVFVEETCGKSVQIAPCRPSGR